MRDLKLLNLPWLQMMAHLSFKVFFHKLKRIANQIEIDLGNRRDTLYTGKFFIGTKPAIEANLTLDSASDWLFVTSA
jgi:hypothetical protein